MMTDETTVSAIVLDERVEIGLGELCRMCALEEERVVEMVAEGIVEPLGHGRGAWRFTGFAVTRVLRTAQLQRVFEVNLAGAALALELLEELERLRRTQR